MAMDYMENAKVILRNATQFAALRQIELAGRYLERAKELLKKADPQDADGFVRMTNATIDGLEGLMADLGISVDTKDAVRHLHLERVAEIRRATQQQVAAGADIDVPGTPGPRDPHPLSRTHGVG